MSLQYRNSSFNIRFNHPDEKQQTWLSVCILAGLIISASMFGCRAKSGSDVWSRVPKLTPRPLVIPQVWHDSIDEALKESAETGKPILASFTGSDWCHWCVKLKSDVFATDTFGNWAKENVILLELDYPKRSLQSAEIVKRNQELRAQYQISAFPTVLFLDSQGNAIGKAPGYKDDPQVWIDEANGVLGKGKQSLP